MNGIDAAFLAIIVPIVTILVQLTKTIPGVAARKWLPPWLAVAIGLAIAFGWVAYRPPAEIVWPALAGYAAIHGTLAGLAAAGLWSGLGRHVVGGLEKEKG